jgi:hypothetical protein
VRAPKANAYTIWHAIEDQFRDNELHRAVYLEAEFHNLMQGDMDIKTYTDRLKHLANSLRDVGQPVRETSQVLNMLRGLSPKYRHTVPVITSKNPPHMFLSALSNLLLEEQYDKEHAKSTAQHALMATGGSQSGGSRPPAPAADEGSSNTSATPPYTPRPPVSGTWMLGLNPWTSMVQAWPMPFRVPGAGVLGLRPGTPVNQAYIAVPPPSTTTAPTSSPNV